MENTQTINSGDIFQEGRNNNNNKLEKGVQRSIKRVHFAADPNLKRQARRANGGAGDKTLAEELVSMKIYSDETKSIKSGYFINYLLIYIRMFRY